MAKKIAEATLDDAEAEKSLLRQKVPLRHSATRVAQPPPCLGLRHRHG